MDASSALSTLSALTRTPSPVSRYHTADEGTSSRGEDVTDISSPGEAADEDHGVQTPYRDALDLPRELRLRCQIHLEEQYYLAALDLLNSTLCEGISHASAPTKPTFVPPPAQLSLLATLAIHPKHTSKLAPTDAHDVAALSLSYLRSVLATVGPVNAKLRDAFVYRGENGGRRIAQTRSRRTFNDYPSKPSQSDEEYIRGKTANGGSIWERGHDFWKVLGWAFNCSAVYPHRWRWWKPWLEFMLDVLEADYEDRKRLDQERERSEQCYQYHMLQDSLLVSYIAPKNILSNPVRTIMNSVFAEGNSSSLSVFKEVFTKETRVASKSSKKRKHHRLDLENDEFGDYDDDSSTGGSEPPTPEHQRTSARCKHAISWADTALAESIPLRLRVFALLSRAGSDVGDKCQFTLEYLYHVFVEKLIQLPLPAFARFIAGHDSPLEVEPLVAIIRLLLRDLLPSTIPKPCKVDSDADAQDSVSPAILMQCYLPFAYRAADNNAKISITVETLFRIMWAGKCIQWAPTLHTAVLKGIKARNEKSAPKRGQKDNSDQVARDMLRASASRLLALSEISKAQYNEAV